jgi:hypothetical protein
VVQTKWLRSATIRSIQANVDAHSRQWVEQLRVAHEAADDALVKLPAGRGPDV